MGDELRRSVCPKFQYAVEVLGKRWTGAILQVLRAGPRRFNELSRDVAGITDRLLSERLKELVREGWVHREVEEDPPLAVSYSLTAKGEELGEALDALHGWADRWVEAS